MMFNRFKVVDVDDNTCGSCSGKQEYYIVDNSTKKFIAQCTNFETAEMVCIALNFANSDGLLP